MAKADYWPQEEGYIVEASPVMMCEASGAITEMECVKLSSTSAGKIVVEDAAAWGDSIGVALRAVSDGQMVPVAFAGIVKMLADATLALGQQVCNSAAGSNKIIDTPTSVNIKLGDNGTAYVLGITLQEAADDEDEILVLLGRW
jgi:hypothetical protein